MFRDGGEDGDSQGDGSSQPDTISIASRTSQNTVDSDKVGSMCSRSKLKYDLLLNRFLYKRQGCSQEFSNYTSSARARQLVMPVLLLWLLGIVRQLILALFVRDELLTCSCLGTTGSPI